MQGKIKILIYLALWRRPEITELCFKGIERLKRHPDFDIQVLAVASEAEMLPLCEKYGVHVVTHDNLPLGRKKNFGLKAAKSFEFDYLMEIGSDNLILSELLDEYKKDFIGLQDFFGIADIVFIDTESESCRRVTRKRNHYGAGRMMSRAMLETLDFKMWPDMSGVSLDTSSVHRLATAGFFYRQVSAGEVPLVVDIKSQENIWPFDHSLGGEYDINLILEKLSQAEVDAIKELRSVYAEK